MKGDMHSINPTDDTQATGPAITAAVVRDKLNDAQTPGFQVEFDPEEAEMAGAFAEDALSEQDAAESVIDLADSLTPESAAQKATQRL